MESIKDQPPFEKIPINSQETALCIIPPSADCADIDRLRELYDKGYGKWPAHINLIYPFVAPENLPRAHQQIKAHFDHSLDISESQTITLLEAGMFKHRNNSNVFIQEVSSPSESYMTSLRSMALQALGQKPSPSNLHLTIGQTEDNTLFSQQFLLSKARLLPALHFRIGALAILIRERASGGDAFQYMKLWGIIEFAQRHSAWIPSVPEHWIRNIQAISQSNKLDPDDCTEPGKTSSLCEARSGSAYQWNSQEDKWILCQAVEQDYTSTRDLSVSSYNVLVDSEYPPTRDRDAYLLRNILADAAAADILVLQEMSDDFLSYILGDSGLRERYPFTSHGPPDQADLGPLPSLRNIVMLSRWPFTWKFVPFQRKHKGALVAKFKDFYNEHLDLVVAGVHLTAGLTDSSVAAKKAQLQSLTDYLTQQHDTDCCILAGDFNLVTSSYTISTALKDNEISGETVEALSSIETALGDAGLVDTWTAARVEAADEIISNTYEELFEGEEGATFDPRNNLLAAASFGTSNGRPQRYDRIFVRSEDCLKISRCNTFGLPEDVDGAQVVASDHSGIRSTLEVMKIKISCEAELDTIRQHEVERKRASSTLSSHMDLTSSLTSGGMFPTDEEVQQRATALSLLKEVILGVPDDIISTTSEVPMIIVPVGSYALGVWTSESDIDCLCIGTISSKTFFKLARQRLNKAHDKGVRVLRKVEASTGTMLELSVNGIYMDLQYCPAASVIERWSEFKFLPSTDPIFNLSILSLRKLKPYRDLLYIQRTLPSLPAFRTAYRCIKLWAVEKGVYSAKFGYLGGVHITLMLSWVAKRLTHEHGPITAADLVVSFFNHFARFNWANEMMYDAFFHKQKPRYHRSAREPMVILGFHAPNSNIAHTSTSPSLQTLINEMKAADESLSEDGMTWQKFFMLPVDRSVQSRPISGSENFLTSHSSYAKIDIQFWGRTLAKGKSLVGWVESRCLSLVVNIHKALSDLQVRLWPARFTDSDTTGGDYHGCYLIGLSRTPGISDGSSAEEKLTAKETLDKVLDRFLSQLKTDEKNYDASISWIDVSLARPKDVINLRPDDREWGDYIAELDPDSDDEEDLEDPSDEPSEPIKRTIPQRPKPTAMPLSSAKLRPASDVLHRLRWDPNLDPADYIIGYEDRFLGARETGLEKWKTEQTDDEFIPQHRILYFKKKDDGAGEIVWDRAKRIDTVFGSGVGAGQA